MHTGSLTATKTVRIVPRYDMGVPDLERESIHEEVTMELNLKEIIRAMNYADVYEILEDGSEVLLDTENFNDDNSDLAIGSESDPIVPDLEGDIVTHCTCGLGCCGLGEGRFY